MAILAIFRRFIQNYHNETDRWELLEAMMELRAEFAINHAIKGFGMDIDKALDLVRHHNDGLTQLEKEQRDILVAAMDNLIDFAVAQEFQMADSLPDDIDPDDQDALEEYEKICERYNSLYAHIENGDIEFAMGIAAWWAQRSQNVMLTYMTQGDERVRPWHRALEGLSYPKRSFPAWLIPPIEHGCRCFLVEEDWGVENKIDVTAIQAKKDQIPDFISPVFRESVAKGGRIFSDAHSYFQIRRGYKSRLKKIAKKIKEKWLQ